MDDFLSAMNIVFEGLKMQFTIYGFTLSLWDVLMLTLICSIVVGFVKILWNI